MFSKVVASGVVAICALAAPAAFADRMGEDLGDGDVQVGPTYDYAQVVSVDPIVRQVRVETPRRECWTDTSYVAGERPGAAGRMILGGLIGAAIGHEIGEGHGHGHGHGQETATVAGAVIGTAIGHDAGPHDYYQRPVERCDVRYESTYEERIDGYNVVYLYGGRRHMTRLPYDPGERIKVRVDVAPAEG
jgi:uncharacterized protein YcfJ